MDYFDYWRIMVMKNKQTSYWKLDTFLFLGFLTSFWLDLTGLWLHQWLGIFVGAFAIIHMFIHWKWIKTTIATFTSKVSIKSRRYMMLDIGLLSGFIGIIFTGVIMSTWLQLNLDNYTAWLTAHIAISISALIILLFKLAVHGKWIVAASRKVFSRSSSRQAPLANLSQVQLQIQEANDRRAFLRMMGIVGAASVFALARAADGLSFANAESLESSEIEGDAEDGFTATHGTTQTANPTATPVFTQASTATTAATEEPIVVATQAVPTQSSCVIRCQKRCAYPGHCGRYVDSNSNGYCDNGECL
jgi:hypothetical protein